MAPGPRDGSGAGLNWTVFVGAEGTSQGALFSSG